MKTFQLLYGSTATAPFGKPELLELLNKSRANNERVNVTGLLLFKDGQFMQVLEGEEPVVTSLYQRISQDPRHTGSMVFLQRAIEQRDFPDWSMAFKDLRDPELLDMPGYSEFLNVSLADPSIGKDASKAKRLLSVFRTAMRG
ncbi:MAG: BLUF domain-containing protein [Verrucomicrobia bacterium]|nr:BLUF domain-containing protein [Verrucomicrobiota bacterium]